MNWLMWLLRGWVMQSASQAAMDAVRGAAQDSGKASDSAASGQEKPTADEEDTPRPAIVIIAALRIEIAPLLASLKHPHHVQGGDFVFHGGFWKGHPVAIVESGIGLDRARRATHAAIDAFNPQWIISAGFAGGLDPALSRGSLILAENVQLYGTTQPAIQLGLSMVSEPANKIFTGSIVTVPQIVRTTQEKQAVFETTKALAAEMETWGVAEACRTRHCRMISIRVISDDAKTNLPPEIMTVSGPTGSVRAGALVGAILNRPGSVSDLWSLRESALQSSERLSAFVQSVMPMLLPSKA